MIPARRRPPAGPYSSRTSHNAASGRCFPSYDRIAEAAGCARSTIASALRALETAGLLSVCNRLIRVRWHDATARAWRIRVMRTSNSNGRTHEGTKARKRFCFVNASARWKPAPSLRPMRRRTVRAPRIFVPVLAASFTSSLLHAGINRRQLSPCGERTDSSGGGGEVK